MGLQFIEFIHRSSFKEICGSMELERKLVFVLCDNLKKKVIIQYTMHVLDMSHIKQFKFCKV